MLNWGVCVLLDLFESAACAMVITLDLLPRWQRGDAFCMF